MSNHKDVEKSIRKAMKQYKKENRDKSLKHKVVQVSTVALAGNLVAGAITDVQLIATGIAHAATAGTSFNDVDTSSWSYKYITKVAALGFTVGDDIGKFNPDSPVSHQEAVSMAIRFLGIENPSVQAGNLTLTTDAWARDWVLLAIDKGLIVPSEENGTANGSWGRQLQRASGSPSCLSAH